MKVIQDVKMKKELEARNQLSKHAYGVIGHPYSTNSAYFLSHEQRLSVILFFCFLPLNSAYCISTPQLFYIGSNRAKSQSIQRLT